MKHPKRRVALAWSVKPGASRLRLSGLTTGFVAGLFLLAALAACARVGPPKAPYRRIPPPPSDLAACQEGGIIHVRCTFPAENLDGSPLHEIRAVEILGGLIPPGVEPRDTVGWGLELEKLEGDRLKAFVRERAFAFDLDRRKCTGEIDAGRAGFAVRFANEKGHWSAYTPIVITPVAAVNGVPENLSARAGKEGVTLQWHNRPAAQPGGDCAGYTIRRREEPDGKIEDVGTAAKGDETYTDSTTLPGRRYAYAVAAFRTVDERRVSGEFSPWSTAVDTRDVFAPDSPENLSVVVEDGKLRLIWNPVADPDLAGYLVYRADGTGNNSICLTPRPVSAVTFTDTSAELGKPWRYTVVAVDAVGNRSAPSAEVEWKAAE